VALSALGGAVAVMLLGRRRERSSGMDLEESMYGD